MCHPDKLNANALMACINTDYQNAITEIKSNKRRFKESKFYKSSPDYLSYEESSLHMINKLKIMGISSAFGDGYLFALGNTYPHKEILKHMGFKWCASFKLWYWSVWGGTFDPVLYGSFHSFLHKSKAHIRR